MVVAVLSDEDVAAGAAVDVAVEVAVDTKDIAVGIAEQASGAGDVVVAGESVDDGVG